MLLRLAYLWLCLGCLLPHPAQLAWLSPVGGDALFVSLLALFPTSCGAVVF